jgi:hypothetical protein
VVAHSLEDVQTNDALKREELEYNTMLRQEWLMVAVESQRSENGNGSDDDFDYTEPDM